MRPLIMLDAPLVIAHFSDNVVDETAPILRVRDSKSNLNLSSEP